ncbi:hypothetical protein [Dysgonomonas massiliensis]|uniref:hypothetical protein n=1 Tax=Dysgonomonas massiliensis TaxID=2040292 RepID=UPI0011AF9602|nr:hypothetical protein [Dysgonomonas massiliensis]
MRKIYLFFTAILTSLFVISCDRGEDPTYNDLSLESTDVVLNLTKGETVKEVKLLSNNNNYRIEYVNKLDAPQLTKDTARVELQEGKDVFTFIGKKRGVVYFKLYDWTNQESIIKVDVKETVDLVLDLSKNELEFRQGDEERNIEIYDGNGNYEFTFDDPEQKIVDVNLVEPEEQDLSNDPYQIKGNITIIPKNVGKTTLKITDSEGKKVDVAIEVKDVAASLQFVGYDPSKILFMETNSTLVIPFEGGEPGYEVTSSSSASILGTSIDTEAKTITLSAKNSATQPTVTLTDGSGQKIVLIVQIDKPFLEDKTLRIFKNRKRSTISNTLRGGDYIPSLNRTIFEVGSTYTSYGITYTGDVEVGTKSEARIYDISKGQEKEGTSISLSVCTLEKVEDNHYWFTFTEEETGDEGYMVFKGPDVLGF